MNKNEIIILSENHKLKANKQLSEEIKKAGYIPNILKPSKLQAYLSDKNRWDLIYDSYKGKKPQRIITGNILAVIPRIGRYLRYSSFIVEQFTNKGIYSPQTAEALLFASDKMKTLQKCSAAGIRVPKTIFIRESLNIDFIIEKIGLPFIVKTTNGSQGKGVAVVDSKRSATSIVQALLKTNNSLILQEFINGKGEDIRAVVVGNKVVASMVRRKSNKNDFRANLSLGGYAEKIVLDETLKTFCINASKAVGLDISGVDIMLDTNNKPVLIEVNTNFGFKVQKVTKVNIAHEMVRYIIAQANVLKEKTDAGKHTDIFKNSAYLQDVFSQTKGKILNFTNRSGMQEKNLIKTPNDIYSIMEKTFKIQ